MLFGGIFDLISRIIFGVKSDQNRIDDFKLLNNFNSLQAKSLLYLIYFILVEMVGLTGIEPVTPSMSTKCSPAELYAPIVFSI